MTLLISMQESLIWGYENKYSIFEFFFFDLFRNYKLYKRRISNLGNKFLTYKIIDRYIYGLPYEATVKML